MALKVQQQPEGATKEQGNQEPASDVIGAGGDQDAVAVARRRISSSSGPPLSTRGTPLPVAARQHDILNLWLIGVLNLLNVVFLLGWSGGMALAVCSVLYFATDIIFVCMHPDCVKAPNVIIVHHLLALGLITAPFVDPQFMECLAHCMLVEINTWLLISKRTINFLVPLQEALFYISWVVLRLMWYPYMVLDFYRRWLRKCEEIGTHYNIYVLGPIFMLALVGLNVHWTLSLLLRISKPRPKQS